MAIKVGDLLLSFRVQRVPVYCREEQMVPGRVQRFVIVLCVRHAYRLPIYPRATQGTSNSSRFIVRR